MTTGIIIQARMTSKRFPGKSMALLAGKPVLQHVIERCKGVWDIDKIIVAMPDHEASLVMGELCSKMDVLQFFGSEEDVLKRYYDAAKYFHLDIIMRITGDCPLIEPARCRNLLYEYQEYEDEYQYASNGIDCEVFSFACLERAHQNATDPYDREHVTPWMKREAAMSVDYPEDIQRLEAILARSH